MRISDWSSDVCSSDLKPIRIGKRDMAVAACEAMGWAVPDSVVWFVQRVEAAKQRVLKARELKNEVEERKEDRKSVVSGKSVSVRVDLGGRRIITTKKNRNRTRRRTTIKNK